MRENLGLILGALSVFIVVPILLWVAREPSPPQRKPATSVHAAKTIAQGNNPSVTLGWSANSEPGLAGYRIYYKTESRTPPHDGRGLTEGDSPIDVPLKILEKPENPKFTLHGLKQDKTYFFTITAYNSKGGESGFSQGITFKPPKTN
jgi:hypothetical protein